jgi:hypothetical protein
MHHTSSSGVRTLTFIIAIFIISCSTNQTTNDEGTDNKAVEANFKLSDSQYVIFQDSSKLRWIFEDSEPTSLNEQELIEIERIIQIAIEKNNKEQADFLAERNSNYPNDPWTETGFELSIKGYYRQYVPVINERGEKEVWINFFCDPWGTTDWKSNILHVDDGGNCYFNLKANLKTGTYYELSINGYA